MAERLVRMSGYSGNDCGCQPSSDLRSLADRVVLETRLTHLITSGQEAVVQFLRLLIFPQAIPLYRHQQAVTIGPYGSCMIKLGKRPTICASKCCCSFLPRSPNPSRMTSASFSRCSRYKQYAFSNTRGEVDGGFERRSRAAS